MRSLEKGLRLEQLLAQHFALHDVDDYSPARFLRMLEDGRVVLLFDGFDELVVRSTYARAAEHFETIVSAARGRAKVVVTSRRQHFLSDHQAKEAVRQVLMQKVEVVPGHRVVALLPFEDDQIERFLAKHLGDLGRARERMRLIAEVRDLSGLSANPRMLGFIAALTEDELRAARDQQGSVSAAGLYRSLLGRWLDFEQDRRHPRGAAPGLPLEARWAAVTELAVRLWTRGEHHVGVDELEEIGAVLVELAKGSKEEAGFQIGSGTLLVRDEIGRFSFIHESVLEWLVARAAALALEQDPTPALLGQGKMSPLLADFLIDLAGAEAVERWSTQALAKNLGNATADNALLVRQRLVAAGLAVEPDEPAGVDLRGQDLRGQDLSGQSLAGAILTEANLQGANLRGAGLMRAELREANLRWADLRGADLRGADLRGADLREASLVAAHLGSAQLEGVDLRRAKLLGTRGAELALARARTEGAALPGTPVEPMVAEPLAETEAVSFSGDGALMVIAGRDRWRLFDAKTGFELQRQAIGDDMAAAFGGHWRGEGEGSPRWHQSPLSTDTERSTIGALAVAIDGHITAHVGDRLALITPDQRIIDGLLDCSRIHHLALCRNGLGVVTAAGPRIASYRFFPFEGIEPMVLHHQLDAPPARIAAVGQGSVRVLVATRGERSHIQELRLLDDDTTLVHHGTVEHEPTALASTPDGRWMAVACADRSIHVFSPLSHEALAPPLVLCGHRQPVTALDLNDEPLAVSGSADGSVRVWDLLAGQERHAWSPPEGVTTVALGPAAHVAAGGPDGTLLLWRSDTGEPLGTTLAHHAPITALTFCDRTRLATGSTDGTVRLWHLPSLTLLATLAPLPEGWVAFAPDGRYKTGGRVAGQFWHAAALCRFEVGELDDVIEGLRLGPDDALVDPAAYDGA